ncbi:hypothetical protein [Leptospira borgpetersenii]|uniref:hypothetical protein n=1 Tax=Leptospira borgpetersenii TaxID=174 RepID=UPI000AD80230|nr:hypothetical protein [Leptospira borgpetersenii]MBE8435773.1 hypothetical protein [Leptospira borgpetersenii serovar Tarassovi]UVA63013.1 hypothetical protein LH336_09285 [Leptospira borgpetersenii]
MLFSNELNYWVIKKICEKRFTAPDGVPYQSRSQNLGCRNSYESVPTIKSVRKSINHRSAGISTLYYELMK